jgi:hypothetical protein
MGVNIEGYVRLQRISIPRKWPDIALEAGADSTQASSSFAAAPPNTRCPPLLSRQSSMHAMCRPREAGDVTQRKLS